ncbi:hypothetical protein RYX36_016425 [Vicia faba]
MAETLPLPCKFWDNLGVEFRQVWTGGQDLRRRVEGVVRVDQRFVNEESLKRDWSGDDKRLSRELRSEVELTRTMLTKKAEAEPQALNRPRRLGWMK